jgi:hypothetical protein
VVEVPLPALKPILPSNPGIRLRADLVALYIPVLSIAGTTLALLGSDLDAYAFALVALEYAKAPDIAVCQALDYRALNLTPLRGEDDDGVVGTLDVAALVHVKDCGADGEQRGAALAEPCWCRRIKPCATWCSRPRRWSGTTGARRVCSAGGRRATSGLSELITLEVTMWGRNGETS